MLEQALAEAVGTDLSPLQRIDVVVHLDVADAVVVYQSCHHLIEVSRNFRVAEVEQKSRILQCSFSMTHEKPIVWFLREH